MPRPGFVLEVDRSTPPLLFWRGESFSLERLPAGPQPGRLRARAARPGEGRRWRHPSCPARTRRRRSAPRPAVPRHEADDRLRRREPAAAEDAPAGPAPAGHRGRARPGRRGRRGRRPPHRRARAPPSHDRGGAAPRRRRPGLRRVRHGAAGCTTTTPRTQTTWPTSAPRRSARRWRSTSGRPRATCSSTSTSTSCRWTAAGSRPPPAWSSYRSLRHHHNVADHAALPLVHGPAPQRAAPLQLAHGQGAHRRRA